MPATEQTWRESKMLHVVFGVSSLAMLVTTVWMLAADHFREWKGYQRQFRDVETWSTEAQIAQANNDRYSTERARLVEELQAAQREVPPRELIDQFEAEVTRDYQLRKEADQSVSKPSFDRLEAAYKNLTEGDYQDKPDLREKLLIELDMFVVDARFREATLSLSKKSTAAEFDVERSNIGIAVDNNAPQSELDRLQKQTDAVKERLAALTQQVQDATTHRKALEKYVVEFTADVSAARKRLADHEATLAALDKALYEREDNWGKELLAMPIIDAFGRPLKVDQIWLPKLTINNNFRDVARFDRCTTCHQGMDKTAPGSATEPGYKPTQIVNTTLATPAEAPEAKTKDAKDNELSADEVYKNKLEAMYGIQLSKIGLLHDNDVTVSVVRPESPAALARIQVGDVITYIGDVKILDRPMALSYLVDNVELGKPLALTIRRGLPNPFTSHPRLDLFVGSLSPHKMADIGCTICHEGQGSATDFKYASHTPNDPRQADDWKREHGWYNNHHWIFPMNPQRFAESSCLKCHHEVVELEKSERFPDPPAPKLTEGHNIIRQYGCFGCHEINGYDGPTRRVGPDMRAEPNYSAAAQALLATGELSNQQAAWASQVALQPEDDIARRQLLQSIKSAVFADSAAGKSASDEQTSGDEKPAEKLKPVPLAVRKLSGLLDDVESPGKLRKVGPGLRHVASKLDYDFLYSWIRKPKDFRPSTKMPQFFGLTEHLSGKGLEDSEKFEPIEIRGVTEYLLAKSQPFKFAKLPTEEPSAERGKKLFETRGCLACHQHKDFPKAEMNQGPDLSLIGAKLKRANKRNAEEPEGWLYTWLRDPSNYHPRTLMPNLKLDPIKDADGATTHPADDIAAFLLTGDAWTPTNIPARKLDAAEQEALEELALDHLKNVFPLKEANRFLETGIPEDRADELKGDEVELLGTTDEPAKMAAKKLQYVGRRTISKYGCAGCHDIPGFEDSKPIGTGLADWGRKSADKLAFEQIGQYILQGHGAKGHGDKNKELPLHEDVQGDAKDAHAADESHALGHHEIKFLDLDPTEGFFLKSLMGHERTGFIWQKLRAPRSYDFMKTENKGYNERLRMPLFNLDEKQREAVIAFVLGLLAEPPAAQYIYQPTPRRKALIEGQRIVEKFNCGGCHTLQMDQWQLAYQESDFSDPSPISDFPQLEPHFTPQQIKASLATDVRGMRHATLTGMPIVSPDTGEPVAIDEDGAPIDPEDKTSRAFYPFMPWDSVLINGQVRPAGVQNLLVPASAIEKRYAPEGGYLARLIYPVVVADERKLNPNAKADEAWGWLPPPLFGEGRKVQSAWLHDFLLDPFEIRPAVVLRMPKFNMSSAEASALAAYFAAVDNVQYPYDFDQRQRGDYLAQQDKDHPDRLQDALKIVTDNNFCIKCHLLGDFTPSGSDRAKAPHLDQVYKRLRPDYVWPWIANPKRILPYTGMPVNIPHDKPVSQELFKGDSLQQLNAVVDLLLNYDRYTESQVPIKSLIKAPPAADAAEPDKQRAEREAKPASEFDAAKTPESGGAKSGPTIKAATDQASR